MRRNVSLTAFLFVMLLAVAVTATAQVSFPYLMSYQGHLTDDLGAPLDTALLMTFTIYDDSTGGGVWWSETQVVVIVNGLFSVQLGSVIPMPDTVMGTPVEPIRYLGIQVASDPEIYPRTRLVSVPYAFRVASVGGATGGTIFGDVAIQSDLDVDGDLRVTGKATIGPGHINNGSHSFVAGQNNYVENTGSTVGGGSVNLATQMYATVSGGGTNTASGEYSSIGGGAMNLADGQYCAVGGGRGDTARADYTTIGGGASNSADSGYATVAGGAENTARGLRSTVGGGSSNFAGGWRSTVAGGAFNATGATQATVSGGQSNFAGGINSTVGGGYVDSAKASGATVSGGNYNTAGDAYSTVSGGHFNIASGYESTVGGGYYDTASGHGSTVCGGRENHAEGTYSTIGGGVGNRNAGDRSAIPGGSYDTLTSSANWSMAFGNRVYLNTQYRVALFDSANSGKLGINRDDHNVGGIAYPIHVGTDISNGNGAYLTSGGAWMGGSSRTFKENFEPLGSYNLLTKISDLPVEAWQYKNSEERHIGPVSEDFVEAFDVGTVQNGKRDDKYLSPGDVAGVALAGVKELIQKNEVLAQQNQELREMLQKLTQRVNQLENEKYSMKIPTREGGVE